MRSKHVRVACIRSITNCEASNVHAPYSNQSYGIYEEATNSTSLISNVFTLNNNNFGMRAAGTNYIDAYP